MKKLLFWRGAVENSTQDVSQRFGSQSFPERDVPAIGGSDAFQHQIFERCSQSALRWDSMTDQILREDAELLRELAQR
jgi:hypothetical protein